MRFFVTCPKGLESLLEEELSGFGATSLRQTQAGVEVQGELEFAYRACLWSRLANRVLLLLDQVDASTAETLYQGVKQLDWLAHLRPTGTLTVDFNGKNTAINNTHFGALKVKDAIVDAVREKVGSRPSVDKDRPDLRINVHLRREHAQIAIDLSGDSLHRRGYRQQTGAAPLKENLAAALLMRCGWISSERNPYDTLVDPMCGSGTLLTEAALIAADIAPGFSRRSFGFDRWMQHDRELWNRIRSEAQSRKAKGLSHFKVRLLGFDADADVLNRAQENIDKLGLTEHIQLKRADVASIRNPAPEAESGLLLTNPPYGERLGETSTLRFLYKELGDRLKASFVGWRVGVFTSNPELGKVMGLRADKLYRLFNGALPSQLLLFSVFAPETVAEEISEDAAEAGAQTVTQDSEGLTEASLPPQSQVGEMLENRIRKNLKKLARWVKRDQIEAYRVYDADIPEYAVAIDLYAGQIVVQEYAPPASVDQIRAFKRLQEVLAVCARVFEVGTNAITLKQRKRQQGTDQYQRQSSQDDHLVVTEYGCKFEVNLKDFLDTGLFLDHRPVRKMIQARAKGKRFLNLFCYTATASVHAALGGAATTTSVDMSATYLDWAKRNFALNDLKGDRYRFLQADCIQWLERPSKERFDLIFMDPPTFSNSKRMSDVLDVQRDHVELVRHAMSLLDSEGTLIFSNNYRRFKLDYEALSAFEIRDITSQTIDQDFKRNAKIHSCFEISHRKSDG